MSARFLERLTRANRVCCLSEAYENVSSLATALRVVVSLLEKSSKSLER